MLEYDGKKKILYAFKSPFARPRLEIERGDAVTYRSFRNYIENQVRDDVMEILMPALRQAINKGDDSITTTLGDISVKTVDPGYFNDRAHHVCVKFNIPRFDGSKAGDVTVLKLPTVTEEGIIINSSSRPGDDRMPTEVDAKKYAFIHMLEQEPAVSYEANESTNKAASLKIKNGARSIWIDDDAKKVRIRFSDRSGKSSKTKYTLIDLIAAMAKDEGYDIYKIWDEFANFSITNMFTGEDDKINHLLYCGPANGSINSGDYRNELVPRLRLTRLKQNGQGDESYDNTEIRDAINKLLSLDRAIGETLAKDVYSVTRPSSTPIARAGDTIDETMIQAFRSHGVYCIYVKYVPAIEGYYLSEDIMIHSAVKGLKLTKLTREYFPEEKGMYLSKDYIDMKMPIFFNAGDALTTDMIETIIAFGRDSILVSDKKTGGKVKKLNFYEEIMSNRQVLGDDIGRNRGQWYYLNPNNMYIENNGSYTTYDLVALQSFVVKLFEGKWIGQVVNSDAGFRKHLVTLEEQYHRAFVYAVREGMQQMSRTFREIYKSAPQKFLNRDQIDNSFYAFEKKFWEYLRDNAKCIVALQSDNVHNPIAYQSACTKVNVYTANKHSVADTQREIAIGSYGKIDPYEIPQSGKMGTVYNSCCGLEIDEHGKMRTTYYPVQKLYGDIYKVMFDSPVSYTSAQEEGFIIADICSLELNENGIIMNPNDNVLCRVPASNTMENQTFASKLVREVNLVNADATQPLSWSSSTIPFMGSNDAARAIFAVAQEKAVKGLVNTEEPDVITSAYEQFPWLNDKFGIIAQKDGIVVDITYNYTKEIYDMYVQYDGEPDMRYYSFKEYFDSGYSVTKLKVRMKKNQRFKRGEMLVSSNFISDNGILQFGCNALVAYHCDGYNYEDGSHISESMCKKLTSYRINKEEFLGNPSSTSRYSLDKTRLGDYIADDARGTIRASYVYGRDSVLEKRDVPITKAYGFVEKFEHIRPEHSLRSYGSELRTVSVDEFSLGDKASNRHGNKGVLARKEPTANMPRLKNGMPIDVSLNPLGVGSRMNIGQIKEAHCGLFSHVLGIKLSTDAYNAISDNEIHMLMSLTVDLMDSTGDPHEVTALYADKVPAGLLEWCCYNIKNIRRYAGCFNKRGTTKLILPDNEGRETETEVLIGYIYMFKLIQEAHKKIHARGNEMMGEPYGKVTNAPTQGSSNGGGQRFGTMEMNAVCAYGASAYAQELTNERCDNGIARNNLYVDTYLPSRLRDAYRINSKGQRRSVTQLLYSLLALGVMCEPEDGEFLPLSRDNGVELGRWKMSALRSASKNSDVVVKNDEETADEPIQSDEINDAWNTINGIMPVPAASSTSEDTQTLDSGTVKANTGIEAFDAAINAITNA